VFSGIFIFLYIFIIASLFPMKMICLREIDRDGIICAMAS